MNRTTGLAASVLVVSLLVPILTAALDEKLPEARRSFLINSSASRSFSDAP
ncbi:MAG: hypothetical protein ACYTG0_26845 [Planctomycetota bacterium]|jgi:hypothetical protein